MRSHRCSRSACPTSTRRWRDDVSLASTPPCRKFGRPGRKLDRHLDALAARRCRPSRRDPCRTRRLVAPRTWRESLRRDHVGNAGSARPVAQKKTCHAAEQERADVAAAREAWRETQGSLSIDRLVFIDETWATTNMTRRYGRAPSRTAARCRRSARALENNHLHRRPDRGRIDGTGRHRRGVSGSQALPSIRWWPNFRPLNFRVAAPMRQLS